MATEKIIKWIKRYWWIVLLAILAGVALHSWRSETASVPAPVVEEVADRAISTADDIDAKLRAIQAEVTRTRQEVKRREKKITVEVQDMDCVALASRWNRVVATERRRRISGNETSGDR